MSIKTKLNPLGGKSKSDFVKVVKVQTGGYGGTTWALKEDGTLWGCGNNNVGQLGTGDANNIYTFTQRLTDVVDFTCGSNSAFNGVTYAVKSDGTLWATGYGNNGQQGNGSTNNVFTFTQRLTGVKAVITDPTGVIAWAWKTDNSIWGCGANNNGQLGTGDSNTTFLQRATDVIYLTCSQNSTWIIKSADTAGYGCGYGGDGQQGNNGIANVGSFTLRLGTQKAVACTSSNSFGITLDHGLYGCGSNFNAQLGNVSTDSRHRLKIFTRLVENVKSVHPTGTSTWLIKNDNTLWCTGANTYGQLGTGNTTALSTFTQRMDNVKKVLSNSTGSTTWVIKNDGTLWGCGRNNYGQQGSGDTNNVLTFTQRLTNVVDVAATTDATWAVRGDGTLWGCGNNAYGQQGSGDTNTVYTFTKRNF